MKEGLLSHAVDAAPAAPAAPADPADLPTTSGAGWQSLKNVLKRTDSNYDITNATFVLILLTFLGFLEQIYTTDAMELIIGKLRLDTMSTDRQQKIRGNTFQGSGVSKKDHTISAAANAAVGAAAGAGVSSTFGKVVENVSGLSLIHI